MMKKAKWIIILIVVLVPVIWFFFGRDKGKTRTEYSYTEIEKGDIVNTVTSTGELEPVSVVDVGTQVSGILERVLVDFNDDVKKGQLLAQLETDVLETQLADAKANLDRAQSQLEIATLDYQNQRELYTREFTSEYTLKRAESTMKNAEATVRSAEASLERARRNLNYAKIYSPIDGKVIARNIEPGQTVAASLSAPTLFVIAENLENMRILAKVDESDIGLIKDDIAVKFEVPAFPDKFFDGRVVQIRLQPRVESGVVNYVVVIEAENPDKLLMPGMTATIDFFLDEVRDVVMVSNAALSFQPTEQMRAEMMAEMQKRREERMQERESSQDGTEQPQRRPDGERQMRRPEAGGPGMRMMSDDIAMLWTVDSDGKHRAYPVRRGVTDGRNTAIEFLRDELEVGTEVITRVTEIAGNSGREKTNPFAPTRVRMR